MHCGASCQPSGIPRMWCGIAGESLVPQWMHQDKYDSIEGACPKVSRKGASRRSEGASDSMTDCGHESFLVVILTVIGSLNCSQDKLFLQHHKILVPSSEGTRLPVERSRKHTKIASGTHELAAGVHRVRNNLRKSNRCTLSRVALIDKFVLIPRNSMDQNWVINVKWHDGIGRYALEVHNL